MTVIKLISVLVVAVFNVCVASQQHFSDERCDESTGIRYRIDQFGNVNISASNFQTHHDELDLKAQLTAFCAYHKEDRPNKALITRVSRKDAWVTQTLKNVGFQLHFARDDDEEWVILNGSPMPAAMTAIGGAFALVLNDKGEVLIEADRFRKKEIGDDVLHILWIPGGSVNQGELPRHTACRETHEETGVEIEIERLIYIRNHIHANRYDANDVTQVFLARYLGGALCPQASEIDHVAFVDPQVILKAHIGEVIHIEDHPYYVDAFVYDLLRHVTQLSHTQKYSRSSTTEEIFL